MNRKVRKLIIGAALACVFLSSSLYVSVFARQNGDTRLDMEQFHSSVANIGIDDIGVDDSITTFIHAVLLESIVSTESLTDDDMPTSGQVYVRETIWWSASSQFESPPFSINVTRPESHNTTLVGTLNRVNMIGPTQSADGRFWTWTVEYAGWLTRVYLTRTE